jgi:hypothetical protein
METNFEQKPEEHKYPEVEELVETELPQEKKEEIAKLIFKGQIEGIGVVLKGADLSLSGEINKVLDELDDAVEKIGQNSKQVTELLMSYFNEKVREPLFAKFEELLLAAESDQVQDVRDWHIQAQKKADELWKKWFQEANALADTYQDELIAQIKKDK